MNKQNQITDNYTKALTDLRNVIPEDYILKNELEYSIDDALINMAYKAPEVLSIYFRQYCIRIMKYLPKKNNQWAKEKWDDICNIAKVNNEIIKKSNII